MEQITHVLQLADRRQGTDGRAAAEAGEPETHDAVLAPVALLSRAERVMGRPLRCRHCGEMTSHATGGLTECAVCASRFYNVHTKQVRSATSIPTLLTDYANWQEGAA
jgi:hypothetical protein